MNAALPGAAEGERLGDDRAVDVGLSALREVGLRRVDLCVKVCLSTEVDGGGVEHEDLEVSRTILVSPHESAAEVHRAVAIDFDRAGTVDPGAVADRQTVAKVI